MSITRQTFAQATAAGVLFTNLPAKTVTQSVIDPTRNPGRKLRQIKGSKVLPPVELPRQMPKRINPNLDAYVTMDVEGALAQAQNAQATAMRSDALETLHGAFGSTRDLALTTAPKHHRSTTANHLIWPKYWSIGGMRRRSSAGGKRLHNCSRGPTDIQ